MCLAYRNDGGRVCVVLSPVEKLEMEARLSELIPPASRFGTTFVVRQVRLQVPASWPDVLHGHLKDACVAVCLTKDELA